MLLEKALQYARSVVNGENITETELEQLMFDGKEPTTEEVCVQCQWFLEEYETKQYQKDFKIPSIRTNFDSSKQYLKEVFMMESHHFKHFSL